MKNEQNKLSLTEFMDKYVRINTPKGAEQINISPSERIIIDKATELDVTPYILQKGRIGTYITVNPIVYAALHEETAKVDYDEIFLNEDSIFSKMSDLFNRIKSTRPSGFGNSIDKCAKNRQKRKKKPKQKRG